jgi:hypothetical protein
VGEVRSVVGEIKISRSIWPSWGTCVLRRSSTSTPVVPFGGSIVSWGDNFSREAGFTSVSPRRVGGVHRSIITRKSTTNKFPVPSSPFSTIPCVGWGSGG